MRWGGGPVNNMSLSLSPERLPFRSSHPSPAPDKADGDR